MFYETVGYVKMLTICAASNVVIGVGFSPVGSFSVETEEEPYCLFKEKSQSSSEDIGAIMRRFKKDGVVEMCVADVGMRDALIAAKVNHSKVRITVEFDSAEGDKKGVERDIVISVIEFL